MKACYSLVVLALFVSLPAVGQDKKELKKQPNVFTDPETAPIDYQLQGEYEDASGKGPLAAQVVARGNNKLDVYVLNGGLPGAGWDPKSKKVKIEAKIDAEKGAATFSGGGYEGRIIAKQKRLVLEADDGRMITLIRADRKSPTLGAKPPEGAIILFDGKNVDEWKPGKLVGDWLAVPANSKKSFTNFKLHIEFRTPFQPTAGGQGRGNSGVYVCGREVQVLDSFGLQGKADECGGLYGQRAPDVNMCFPPLVWQTYDIEHRAGKIDPETKKQGSPTITVIHNGVKIHDNVELKGGASKGIIHLQDHGNPVVYRNIWVVEMK